MAKVVWQGFVLSPTNGKPVSGAEIRVFDADSGLATTLYSDRAGSAWTDGNPFFTGPDGFVQFYVDPKRIRVEAYEGSQVAQFDDVLVGTVDDGGIVTANLADGAVNRDKVNNEITTRVSDITAMNALSGPSDGERVTTSGYNPSTNIGGASYYWSASTLKSAHDGIVTHSPTVPWDGNASTLPDYLGGTGETDPSGSGCWVLSTETVVTPRHAGAQDGELAQEDAIEAYFDWAGAQGGVYRMAHDGDYYVSRGVRIEDCASCVFEAGSSLTIRPPDGQYIDDDGVRLFDASGGQWGSIACIGDTGGGGFRNGIVGQRIRRGSFEAFSGNYHRLFGVVIASTTDGNEPVGFSPNNNGTIVNAINATSCGNASGIPIAFTETTRFYNASVSSQTSILSIDLDDYYPTFARGTPFIYNGDAFVVLSYDSVSQEATVYPCMDSDPNPLVSGTLDLLPGGGLLVRGGDSGQLRTEQVNVRTSSVAIMLQSAYGGSIMGLTSQLNGIDIVHGRPPSSFSNANEVLYNAYTENCTFMQVLSLTQANSYIDVVGSISELTDTQVLNPLPLPRVQYGDGRVRVIGSSGATGVRMFGGVPAATSWRRGATGTPIQPAGDQANLFSRPGGTVILSPDNGARTFNFNLGVDNSNTRAFGPNGVALVCLGFAAGNTVTLTAPSGETVEGGATYVHTPTDPDFWIVCGRNGATDWAVRVMAFPSLTEFQTFSDGTTGGAGSAGAGNQYVELEINGTTYKVLHDGTV